MELSQGVVKTFRKVVIKDYLFCMLCLSLSFSLSPSLHPLCFLLSLSFSSCLVIKGWCFASVNEHIFPSLPVSDGVFVSSSLPFVAGIME